MNFINKKTHNLTIPILNLVFFTLIMITPIYICTINKQASLFIVTLITFLYTLFNIILGFLLINLYLDRKNISIILVLGIVFSISNLLSYSYLLINHLKEIDISSMLLNPSPASLTPYLAFVSIVLACKSVHTTLSFKHMFRFLLITITFFSFGIYALTIYNTLILTSLKPAYFLHFIQVSIMLCFYLLYIYLLWKEKHFSKLPLYTYIYVVVFFGLVIISGFLCALSQYCNVLNILIILDLLIAFIFFTIQLNLYLIDYNLSSATREDLYQQNSDIMNKFLMFKNLEVDNLEAEISIKSKLYKELFDFAPDSFAIFNKDRLIYSNQALLELLGAKDNTAFKANGVWDFVHPDYTNQVKSTYNDLLKGAQDVSIVELKIISLDHIVKEVRVSSNVISFEDTYYIFACIHDLSMIHEHQRIQLELESNIALEKLKVEFFANISHDLKTPINVIYSAAQLQAMYALSDEHEQVLLSNNIIKQNCLRLQKLLNDILDITKIDANCFKPRLELCNIIYNIEYITQSITSYVQDKNISIIFDTNVEDKFTMTDPNFIERIMLNLISNAIKYGKQDGHVWVTLFDEGDHIIISVKDDGIGIPKPHLPKIFKRFHTPECSNDNKINSNGIGLSLVQSIVKTLKGTIFCISEEGIGSEFITILPMASLDANEHDYCEYAASLNLDNKLNIELSDI